MTDAEKALIEAALDYATKSAATYYLPGVAVCIAAEAVRAERAPKALPGDGLYTATENFGFWEKVVVYSEETGMARTVLENGRLGRWRPAKMYDFDLDAPVTVEAPRG